MDGDPGPQPRLGAQGGLFASARRMLETLLAIAQTRLELVTTEIEEELHRVAEILLWMFVVVFFGGLAVLMLAFVVVVAFWEDHRLLAASLTTLGFVAVTAIALIVVRSKVRARPKLLEATIEEIKHDREALGGRR
jgi:uncharacterized membrane protein YqjE